MIDYRMPSINGADSAIMILNCLKEKQIIESNLPYIVYMSNFSNVTAIRAKCISAEMDEFVSKPIFKLGIYRLL